MSDTDYTDHGAILQSLHAGLTYSEVAAHLGVSFAKARRLISKHGYQAVDGRAFSQRDRRKFKPEDADWSRPPIEIARKWGISKQRVSRVAKDLGIEIVDSRGRKSAVGKTTNSIV